MLHPISSTTFLLLVAAQGLKSARYSTRGVPSFDLRGKQHPTPRPRARSLPDVTKPSSPQRDERQRYSSQHTEYEDALEEFYKLEEQLKRSSRRDSYTDADNKMDGAQSTATDTERDHSLSGETEDDLPDEIGELYGEGHLPEHEGMIRSLSKEDLRELDPLSKNGDTSDSEESSIGSGSPAGDSTMNNGFWISSSEELDRDTRYRDQPSPKTKPDLIRHPSQEPVLPYSSLLVPGKGNTLKSGVFAPPSLMNPKKTEEPPNDFVMEGYMIRFSRPRVGQELAIEELKCPCRSQMTFIDSFGFVFPEGLHRFKMSFPDFEGAPDQEQVYTIQQQTDLLSESLRLLYIGTAANPEVARKQPVEDTTALLKPIMKALCRMVEDDIDSHKSGAEYKLLKGVPFMNLEYFTAESGKRPTVRVTSEELPPATLLANSVDPRGLEVDVKSFKKGRPLYLVKNKEYSVAFVADNNRLRVNAMSCPGDRHTKKISFAKKSAKPALMPAEWKQFDQLKSFGALEFSIIGDAEVEVIDAAIRWVYAGLPRMPEEPTGAKKKQRRSLNGDTANGMFIQTFCRSQLVPEEDEQSKESEPKKKTGSFRAGKMFKRLFSKPSDD
ncbi:hypothetical protein FOZ62_011034 [Perkinsus olseni]|uniref:Uncharacterized protein n=1 Tax=Perkinsus olseni TaxID=32597 RepID=A0A7J6TPF5_PEROL|nr:hypothetical protein FOZ62_011034 [Perkinsus olseni]